jgi:putative transposase
MKKDEKQRQTYPSDLTDKQRTEIGPLYSGLRKYKWSKREWTDAVLYFVTTGCQWRHLPHDFPLYSTVHSFYRRAQIRGLWNRILQHMVVKTREDAGRKAEPSCGIIDSQSVKTVAASEERGVDGGKNERAKAAHRRRRDGKFA